MRRALEFIRSAAVAWLAMFGLVLGAVVFVVLPVCLAMALLGWAFSAVAAACGVTL